MSVKFVSHFSGFPGTSGIHVTTPTSQTPANVAKQQANVMKRMNETILTVR